MRETKKSKGLSYYFRIEFSSLQGKITTGFCTLGLVSIGLMFITASLLKPSLDKSTYINKVIYPSHLQLTFLDQEISRLLTEGEQTHLVQQTFLGEEALDKQAFAIRKPLDSLKQLAPRWQSKEEQLSLQMAANKAEAIVEKIKAIDKNRNPTTLQAAYGQDLPLLQAELRQSITGITKQQASLRQEHTSFIQERLDNLSWVLALCFVGAFVIGATIGSFIVVKVLAVIRHLKYKILELSEGNLIDPIPPSKDELNSIGNAVNTLTDNLRDIREFAREVGQGNFDSHISVFSNQNDLGQSLAQMRESLKKVDEEDKIRVWTAHGLATFNDFLRNANEDSESFAVELTSRLVKYLELNQGALYLVKEGEHKKALLELKACYAYDRQKFKEKTIEAGQGLVGQVYLEKEHIYLSDIPERFTTISSGLGEATPRYLLVMPLKINQQVNGVLELASFTALPPYKISFLEKLSESISSAIANIQNSRVTQRLLEEAREMASAMKLQEESLRQNSEELQATQEQLEREINGLRQELSLKTAALSAEESPVLLISAQHTVEWMNQAAEKALGRSLSQLKQKPLRTAVPAEAYAVLEKALSESGAGPAAACELLLGQTPFRLLAASFSVKDTLFYRIRLQARQAFEKN